MTRLSARADRRLIRPNNRSRRLVLVEVTAPPATRTLDRVPVNLAFVLDRSGSMSSGKLDLARRAVEEALGRLDGRDRFSIVVYDDVVDVVVESTPASAEARRNAVDRLAQVTPRGSTNLADGWFRGWEQVARVFSEFFDRFSDISLTVAEVEVGESVALDVDTPEALAELGSASG